MTFQFFSRWINNVGRFCGSVISSSSCVLPGKKTRFRSVWFLECLHPTKLIIMFPNAQVSNHLDECLCSCGWHAASISIGIGVSPAEWEDLGPLKLTHFVEKPVSRCFWVEILTLVLKGSHLLESRERNCPQKPSGTTSLQSWETQSFCNTDYWNPAAISCFVLTASKK